MYRLVFGLALAGLAGCTLLVSTDDFSGGAGKPGDDGGSLPEAAAPADGGGEAGVRPLPTGDTACPYPHGMSKTAAWPTRGGCVSRAGRSRYAGPATATRTRSFVIPKPPEGSDPNYIHSGAVLLEDGTMLIGVESNEAGLVAYDAQGVKRWSATEANNSDARSIAADGTIVAASGDSVGSFDPMTGALRWSEQVGGENDTAPAIAANGDVFFGLYKGAFGALSKDGAKRWAVDLAQTENRITTAAFGPNDDAIYVADATAGTLFALNPENGAERWRYAIGAPMQGTPSVADDGTIYVGADDGSVHAVDPSGARRWRTQIFEGHEAGTPAIALDGTLYVGTLEGAVVALSPAGEVKRTTPVGAHPIDPILIDAEGTLFLATELPEVRAIKADGTLLWASPLEHAPYEGPSLAASGTLVVPQQSGKIFLYDR